MRGHRRTWLVTVVAFAALAAVPSGSGSIGPPPPTFTVTSTADTSDADPGDGACADILGHCTLRAAIQEANAKTGLKAIHFDIPGTGVHEISIASALPAVTQPLEIDGYSQPGSSQNTLTTGDNAVLDIQLQGPNTLDFDGLDVDAGGSTVQGLVVSGFANQVEIAGDGDQVDGCFLGTNATGSADGNDAHADVMVAGNGDIVGQDIPGLRNVMGGDVSQLAAGVDVTGQDATVQGNEIGVNAAGTAPLSMDEAILVDGGSGALIGGPATGDGNVVGSSWNLENSGTVVLESAAGNTVQGNLLGVDATGTAGLESDPSMHGMGIDVFSSPNNTIEDNVISDVYGAVLIGDASLADTASSGNTIRGNLVGTDITGKTAIPNVVGITDFYASGVVIGGPDPGDGNVVAAGSSTYAAIWVAGESGARADGAVVEGNLVGTTLDGTAALGNSGPGVLLQGTTGSLVKDNLVSGNDGDGIQLTTGASGATVAGNKVGTNAAGTAALGNYGSGIYVDSSPDNLIGGTGAADANLVSGNGHSSQFNSAGIWLTGSSASGNQVEGNEIGTNAAGDAALPNVWAGVITVNAPNTAIGAPGAGNLISGNGSAGVWLFGSGSTGEHVMGNQLGTNASGTSAVPNGGDGVFVQGASGATVGGTAAGAGNLISGNDSNGVDVQADGTTVQGNLIGTDASGSSPIPNTHKGVYVAGSNNLVGGTDAGAANTIAFNLDHGVDVISGSGDSIFANSIHDNAVLGIDLGDDGVTPNDDGDGDTGPNGLQNFPVVTSATTDTHSGTTVVEGSLDDTPDTGFTVELFASPSCDPSGNGQGTTFLAHFAVATQADGIGTFSRTVDDVPVGDVITATATDPAGSTSEFSGCFTVTEAEYTLSVTKAGGGSGTVTGSPAGIDCGPTCEAEYTDPTQVTLTAAAAAGSTFAGWSGACSGTGACTVTMDSAKSVTASFDTIPNYTLLVARGGTGSGTVTSSPAGIECGASCSNSYPSGTSVTLTATPASGSTFAGWSGACSGTTATCVLTMSAARAVTATFGEITSVPASFELSVAKAGGGSGTVTSSPAGISCGTACSQSYGSGTSVTLTAAPAAGSTFAGWTGACSGSGACTVTMSGARSVTATFEQAAAAPACVVPKLVGSSLAAAKRLLRTHGCRVGTITYTASKKGKAGRVLHQKPKPHTRLPEGARVAIVVAKSRHKRGR